MESIERVWFSDKRIYIQTSGKKCYSRPLEAFPLLMEASPEERAKYEIGLDGDDIHWDDIDEDIHISSFFEITEPDLDNPIANIFNRFPQLNVSEVARSIGINKSLLSKYIYGIKRPSAQRLEQIQNAIRQLGMELSNI